jgi:class 3 adenylate cyclase
LAYQQRAFSIAQKIGDTLQMAKMLSDIGVVEMDLGTNKEDSADREHYLAMAGGHFEQALVLDRVLGQQEDIALVLGNIGNLKLRTASYQEALSHYQEALGIYRQVGNRQGVARNLGNMAEVYKRQYEEAAPSKTQRSPLLELAIDHYQRAIDTARAIGYLEAVWFYSGSLSDALHLAGRDAEALSAFQQYKEAQDSMTSADTRTRIAELQAERELLVKDKQIIIDKLAVAKKRNERAFFMGGIVLLGGVLFFIARERKRSEKLLLNILPAGIAARLKRKEHPIADQFAEASVMFIDMAGFTVFADQRDPRETVNLLNAVFTEIDALAEQWGLEKIKTIGDCYMAVAGVPEARGDHADAAAGMALDLQKRMASFGPMIESGIAFRIGLDCGPVVAGVIGQKKFIYDLWGDAVNTASRMESTGIPGRVHCTERFKLKLKERYSFTSRGPMEVKGKGLMETWLIDG